MGKHETTDPYRVAVEIGQLMERVRLLTAECNRHSGNVVEAWAYATKCGRHNRHMRGCKWQNDEPCGCRAAVASIWPEYVNG
jgi:hypothetical protein